MPAERAMRDVLRNLLSYGPLSFRDFVEIALYHPEFGYYMQAEKPVGTGGDYVTAPTLSPVFSYAIGNLVREFMSRCEGAVFTIVDIGSGDGSLIRALEAEVAQSPGHPVPRFFGVDRATGQPGDRATAVQTIESVPTDGVHFIISNELYDAFPFARLVQRGEHLHELWVTEELEWTEKEAAAPYEDYFAARGVQLEDGQFADVSLEWELFYADVVRRFDRALFVTFDYGHPQDKLFHPRHRRFGTAAAYARQRVTRDLLANPGEQDLTAHINFTDLERAGEREGAATLFFDRLNKFLLTLDITRHELLQPGAGGTPALLQARESARRLILPDGIGEDQRVLVQGKNVPLSSWSFQKKLF
ncbi:MAG TPA: SAM-dependent methyltransferase [Thermoanaerobaculia bacterium]|nr:SAM-dependent methyltransferase [Thermoanaerobaculia bacterium]